MSTGGWPSFVTGSGRETSTPSQESLLRARQLLQQDENLAAEEWVGPGLGWRLATQVVHLPTRTGQPTSLTSLRLFKVVRGRAEVVWVPPPSTARRDHTLALEE
jgi:hypothetical protein